MEWEGTTSPQLIKVFALGPETGEPPRRQLLVVLADPEAVGITVPVRPVWTEGEHIIILSPITSLGGLRGTSSQELLDCCSQGNAPREFQLHGLPQVRTYATFNVGDVLALQHPAAGLVFTTILCIFTGLSGHTPAFILLRHNAPTNDCSLGAATLEQAHVWMRPITPPTSPISPLPPHDAADRLNPHGLFRPPDYHPTQSPTHVTACLQCAAEITTVSAFFCQVCNDGELCHRCAQSCERQHADSGRTAALLNPLPLPLPSSPSSSPSASAPASARGVLPRMDCLSQPRLIASSAKRARAPPRRRTASDLSPPQSKWRKAEAMACLTTPESHLRQQRSPSPHATLASPLVSTIAGISVSSTTTTQDPVQAAPQAPATDPLVETMPLRPALVEPLATSASSPAGTGPGVASPQPPVTGPALDKVTQPDTPSQAPPWRRTPHTTPRAHKECSNVFVTTRHASTNASTTLTTGLGHRLPRTPLWRTFRPKTDYRLHRAHRHHLLQDVSSAVLEGTRPLCFSVALSTPAGPHTPLSTL